MARPLWACYTRCVSASPAHPDHLPRFEPRRELGRTGFIATALGVGDLADRSVPIERCVSTLPEQLREVRLRAAEAVKGKGPCWWNPE